MRNAMRTMVALISLLVAGIVPEARQAMDNIKAVQSAGYAVAGEGAGRLIPTRNQSTIQITREF